MLQLANSNEQIAMNYRLPFTKDRNAKHLSTLEIEVTGGNDRC